MALCPFAEHRLIPPGANDPRITARVAICHVDAGNAESLYDYFNSRSGGIESHFHIKLDGTIEQYRDTDYQADANYLANDFAVSIETQGLEFGEWTPEQLRSLKRLFRWLHKTHGIPWRKIQHWDGSGFGYHVQFGAPGPWTPVAKSCPGPNRIKQFNAELVPWIDRQADSKGRPVAWLVTTNVDFTDKPAVGAANLLSALPGVAIGFVQEAKRLRGKWAIRRFLSKLFGVHQDTSTPAKAGSALVWDKDRVKMRGRDLQVATHPMGVRMLTRYMAIGEATIDDTLKIAPIAAHRPPRRYPGRQKDFDLKLAAAVASAPAPVVIGCDTNHPNPAEWARSLGLKWVGLGIDGFAIDPRLEVGNPTRLPGHRSDHHPVAVPLHVKPLES